METIEQAPVTETSRAVRHEERLTRIEGHIAFFELIKVKYQEFMSLPLGMQIAMENTVSVHGIALLELETLIAKEVGDPEADIYARYIEPLVRDGLLILLPSNRMVALPDHYKSLKEALSCNIRRAS
jgi:hypothetical protein